MNALRCLCLISTVSLSLSLFGCSNPNEEETVAAESNLFGGSTPEQSEQPSSPTIEGVYDNPDGTLVLSDDQRIHVVVEVTEERLLDSCSGQLEVTSGKATLDNNRCKLTVTKHADSVDIEGQFSYRGYIQWTFSRRRPGAMIGTYTGKSINTGEDIELRIEDSSETSAVFTLSHGRDRKYLSSTEVKINSQGSYPLLGSCEFIIRSPLRDAVFDDECSWAFALTRLEKRAD